MENFVSSFLGLFGIEAAFKTVTISPVPNELKELNIPIRKGRCFTNSTTYIENLKLENYKNIHYVLGFGFYVIPIEHCIIRIGDSYYDPSWEVLPDGGFSCREFVSVWELSSDQLEDLMERKGAPPTLFDCILDIKRRDEEYEINE